MTNFNILIIGQKGRIQFEACLFLASLRQNSPNFKGRVIIAEPQPGPKWVKEITSTAKEGVKRVMVDPRMDTHIKTYLKSLGAEIKPFKSEFFGLSYPQGAKIEALSLLPENEPFIFFDTDTLVMGELSDIDFSFDYPSASMRRSGTFPKEQLYWAGYNATWKSLYDRFGLDFESSLDKSQPDEFWTRYLYFNAGWFYYSNPTAFREKFLNWALEIWEKPHAEIQHQPLKPWLDQIVLPLVIHALGGGRPGPELDGLDGDITCHYRVLALLFVRENDKVVHALHKIAKQQELEAILSQYEPFNMFLYDNAGQNARELFDRECLPNDESEIRQILRSNNLWVR